jgi:NADH dehydrogenase [ubiquinone] 1 alpha subcomplex assembly factor 6
MATIPGYVKEVRRKTPVPERRSTDAERLSPVAALVRRHDRDRYQTVLFAPAARREALFALYAFNYEIARVRESVTQPMLGQIRLQWWRENIAAAFEGAQVRHHPVVEGLSVMIRELPLTPDHFDRLIDARECDLKEESSATLAALEDYAEATSSRLVYLALEVLGAATPAAMEAARHIGIAYALAGLLRSSRFHAASGGRSLPIKFNKELDTLDKVAEAAQVASQHLEAARALVGGVSRRALPALLPAVIARQSLARLKRAEYNVYDTDIAAPDPLQIWRLAAAILLKRL